MSRRQFPTLPILVMLAIVAFGYWLYKNITYEEVEIYVEQSAEARNNRLLAASFLLNTEDFEFEVRKTRRVFADLNSTDGVLWLTDTNELEHKREAEKVIEWVESGGILLASPAGSAGLDTSTISGWLLEQFGIVELDSDTDTDQPDNESDAQVADNSRVDDSLTITLPDPNLTNPDIKVFSDYEDYFQIANENPDNAQTIIDTPQIIHRSIGDGYVAVYADEELFDTDRLDETDQGYLLLWLTQPAQSKNVSIVFQPASTPGLFTVVWNKFTLAIGLFGLALIAFLRWAASRLGPVEQELPPIQNNIMAHLEARGAYWYRKKYTDKFLRNVQVAAQESMLSHNGTLRAGADINTTEKSALIKQASAKLQCNAKQAEHVLFGHAENDAAILRMSRALQRLNHFKQYKPK